MHAKVNFKVTIAHGIFRVPDGSAIFNNRQREILKTYFAFRSYVADLTDSKFQNHSHNSYAELSETFFVSRSSHA